MNEVVVQATEKKKLIAAAFGRAAHHYDRHAEFQREVGQHLLDLLPPSLEGLRVLDLGCGTGFFSQLLRERGAIVTCGDISTRMLEQAQQRCGYGRINYSPCDAEAMPFEDESFDIVFSNLALQWCDDLRQPFIEIKRVLTKNGRAYFTTLIEGSLDELRQAWKKVDAHQHVNHFISCNEVKLALAQAEITDHHLSLQTITLRYASAIALMKDLKGIGATHVPNRPNGLVRRETLQQVDEAYRVMTKGSEWLPATYQVCFGVLHR